MKRLFYLSPILVLLFASCGSDDNGPSEITETLAYGIPLTVDIPENALTPTDNVTEVFPLDYTEIDSISGDPTSIFLELILIEIDNYTGGETVELTGGTFILKKASDEEIATLLLDGLDIVLKDYDDANLRIPITISDDGIRSTIEQSLLDDGQLNMELNVEVSDVPAKFDFIMYAILKVTGPA